LYFSEETEYSVFSIAGKEITKGFGKEVNVSDYERGAYILNTTTTKGNSFHSFIKQ